MDMRNWNVDKSQLERQQQELKNKMAFTYLGHGPKATGFLGHGSLSANPACMPAARPAGTICRWTPKAKRCASAAICTAPSTTLKTELPANEIEIFKGQSRG